MITMTGLRTFVAVIEAGGIRMAAQKLHRTPSAVSMTLKQLEKDVGGSLFVSERKSVLSSLGYRVLDEAQTLLAHYDRSSAALRAFAVNDVGRCDVASVPSIATAFLPAAISEMRRNGARFTISVRDMDSATIIDAVDKGAVEIGFCVLNQPRQGIRFEPLLRERLDLVCRADDPLAGRGEPIRWQDIEPREFITNGSVSLRLQDAYPLIQKSRLDARNVASILAMVRAGLGVSALPRLCRVPDDAQIRFLPLADPLAERTVGWITASERKLQPAAARLLEAVKSTIEINSVDLDYEIVR